MIEPAGPAQREIRTMPQNDGFRISPQSNAAWIKSWS